MKDFKKELPLQWQQADVQRLAQYQGTLRAKNLIWVQSQKHI